jgi:murein DD-endopeptidase MepM/ murein hydrolase activator NlpD
VKGHRINSAFGVRKLAIESRARAHKGVDIAAPTGTGVFAAAEGRVIRTGYQAGGYGNFIEVKHPNGMTTLYAHLSRIDVPRGAEVPAGARIGLVGSTGYSTGPHLHFEVRRHDVQVNPAKVIGESFDVRVRVPRDLSARLS